ncbi:MAG: DNA polymerase III subunit delta' [Kofleriaceae bacterium]|nr:DNA polymerase III subunit delta' [Kofleriaceae bacterium]
MPRLSDIRGQDRAVARLRAAIAADRVHHAYLFTGPPGAGKRATALAVAAALNCETARGDGCEVCASCEKIALGIHPDVVTLEREGAAQIVPIEAIRREVIGRVGLPPHEAAMRVFVIDEAAALQEASANALLKTLEEPPQRTMFILATAAPDRLLPTIRSRCQRIAFAALPPDARAEVDAEAAGDDGAARAAHLRELAGLIAGFDPAETRDAAAALDAVLAAAARVVETKGDAAPALELAARRLHEAARAAVAAGDPYRAWRLGERARLVLETQVAVAVHNAHPQLALEALLARIGGLA